MAIVATAVTVTTTATALAAAVTPTGDTFRRGITIQNLGAVPIYVGGSAVTAATGVLVEPYGSFTGESAASEAWYAITAGSTADVRVLSQAAAVA